MGVEGVELHVPAAGNLLPAQEAQTEDRMSDCQCIEVGRISSHGQQIGDALVASMRAALSHSQRLISVTFDRVRGATKKDPERRRG